MSRASHRKGHLAEAKEIAYQSLPPRSKSAMWKIVRYAVDDELKED